MSCRTQRSTASATVSLLTVAWLSESRSNGLVMATPRVLSFDDARRRTSRVLLQERGHPGGRQLECLDQVGHRAAVFQAVEHREAWLQPVQPGEERDARLVVVGRRFEDVAAERNRRADRGVVADQVALIEGMQ